MWSWHTAQRAAISNPQFSFEGDSNEKRDCTYVCIHEKHPAQMSPPSTSTGWPSGAEHGESEPNWLPSIFRHIHSFSDSGKLYNIDCKYQVSA